jgi:hypothetical protein
MGFWRDLIGLKPKAKCECCDEKGLLKVEEPKPTQLYELTVLSKNGSESYSDLVNYNYTVKKNGVLALELTYTKGYKQVIYADKTWNKIEARPQNIKTADIEQVKLAWEDGSKPEVPEFPITLGDPKI